MTTGAIPNTRLIIQPAQAITDASAHISNSVTIDDCTDYLVEVNCSLNQAGTVQLAYSWDGGQTFTNFGTALAVAATSGLTLPAMPSPKPISGLLRATYTASIAPASGTISIAVQKRTY